MLIDSEFIGAVKFTNLRGYEQRAASKDKAKEASLKILQERFELQKDVSFKWSKDLEPCLEKFLINWPDACEDDQYLVHDFCSDTL